MTPTSNATDRSNAEIFVAARHALDERPAVPGTVRLYVDDALVILTGTVRRLFEAPEGGGGVVLNGGWAPPRERHRRRGGGRCSGVRVSRRPRLIDRPGAAHRT